MGRATTSVPVVTNREALQAITSSNERARLWAISSMGGTLAGLKTLGPLRWCSRSVQVRSQVMRSLRI